MERNSFVRKYKKAERQYNIKQKVVGRIVALQTGHLRSAPDRDELLEKAILDYQYLSSKP